MAWRGYSYLLLTAFAIARSTAVFVTVAPDRASGRVVWRAITICANSVIEDAIVRGARTSTAAYRWSFTVTRTVALVLAAAVPDGRLR